MTYDEVQVPNVSKHLLTYFPIYAPKNDCRPIETGYRVLRMRQYLTPRKPSNQHVYVYVPEKRKEGNMKKK